MFVTEDDAQGGVDHIDAHRTVLMAVALDPARLRVARQHELPGAAEDHLPALRRPPLNLYDASATDLSDCSRPTRPAPYKLLPVDARLFDPAKAKIAPPGTPSPRMDRDQ